MGEEKKVSFGFHREELRKRIGVCGWGFKVLSHFSCCEGLSIQYVLASGFHSNIRTEGMSYQKMV